MFHSYINQTKPQHSFTYNSTMYFYFIYDKHKSKEIPPSKSYMNKLLLASPFKFIKCFLPISSYASLSISRTCYCLLEAASLWLKFSLLEALFSRLSVFLVSFIIISFYKHALTIPSETAFNSPLFIKLKVLGKTHGTTIFTQHYSDMSRKCNTKE